MSSSYSIEIYREKRERENKDEPRYFLMFHNVYVEDVLDFEVVVGLLGWLELDFKKRERYNNRIQIGQRVKS